MQTKSICYTLNIRNIKAITYKAYSLDPSENVWAGWLLLPADSTLHTTHPPSTPTSPSMPGEYHELQRLRNLKLTCVQGAGPPVPPCTGNLPFPLALISVGTCRGRRQGEGNKNSLVDYGSLGGPGQTTTTRYTRNKCQPPVL